MKAAFRSMVIAAFDDDKMDIKATLAKIRQILQAQERLMSGRAGQGQSDARVGDVQQAVAGVQIGRRPQSADRGPQGPGDRGRELDPGDGAKGGRQAEVGGVLRD
ncbi:MAG: hypothetical protein GX575_14800 [Candidatus Anammoximicrobium sp.]|nr:hypothetical protein [Candidatus Anammoximicrobium sp.]